MNNRLIEPDSRFAKMAELLPQAVTEMKSAAAQAAASRPKRGAFTSEQKALQVLQKAEAAFEVQVSMRWRRRRRRPGQ